MDAWRAWVTDELFFLHRKLEARAPSIDRRNCHCHLWFRTALSAWFYPRYSMVKIGFRDSNFGRPIAILVLCECSDPILADLVDSISDAMFQGIA